MIAALEGPSPSPSSGIRAGPRVQTSRWFRARTLARDPDWPQVSFRRPLAILVVGKSARNTFVWIPWSRTYALRAGWDPAGLWTRRFAVVAALVGPSPSPSSGIRAGPRVQGRRGSERERRREIPIGHISRSGVGRGVDVTGWRTGWRIVQGAGASPFRA